MIRIGRSGTWGRGLSQQIASNRTSSGEPAVVRVYLFSRLEWRKAQCFQR